MPAATNAQVQAFVNNRVRSRCEQIRALYLACKDDKAVFDDVYANLTNSPTWTDVRPDSPPHLLTPADLLAWNTFVTGLIALVEGGNTSDMAAAGPQYAKVLQGCVRAPAGES